jgi:hypothetical protein
MYNADAPQEFNYDTGSFINLWWLPDVRVYLWCIVICIIIAIIVTMLYSGGRNGDELESSLEADAVIIGWPIARLFAWCITPEHFRGLFHAATIIGFIVFVGICWAIASKVCEHYEHQKAVWIRQNPNCYNVNDAPWYVQVNRWARRR